MNKGLDFEQLKQSAIENFQISSPELGLAVGAIPYTIKEVHDKVEVTLGFHCKTENAPENVKLGRISPPGEKSPKRIRPSGLELKKNPDKTPKKRTECIKEKVAVNSLVALEGEDQKGPVKIKDYNPEETIPVTINTDDTGSRVEEVYLHQVEKLDGAKSVFEDGEFIQVKIDNEGKITIQGKEVPREKLETWMATKDTEMPTPDSDFVIGENQNEETRVNMTVPAAATIKFISDSIKKKVSEQVPEIQNKEVSSKNRLIEGIKWPFKKAKNLFKRLFGK